MDTFFSRDDLKRVFPSIGVFFLFVLLIAAINRDIVLHPLTRTFNFEDNIGYAYQLSEIGRHLVHTGIIEQRNPFSAIAAQGIQIVSPFQQLLGGFMVAFFHVSPVFIVNLVILGNYLLGCIFAYLFVQRIAKDRGIAVFGGVLFGLSSMALYITWFNLAGFCFLPAMALYLVKYNETKRLRDLFLLVFFVVLLSASSTYYVLYPYILLFCFLPVFLPNWRTFLKVCAALCVGTVLAGMCYFIPIYFSTGMSVIDARIVGGALKEESIDVTALLRTNSFNPVTQKYFYLEHLPEAPYFRYSHYFGPATFVLLCASIVYAIRIRTTLSMSALYLLLVGIILFLGERLFVFGYDTGVLLPFYFLHLLSYGNIIRKSTYFFHLIAFSATILTTLFLAYMPKNNRRLLIAVFVGVVLLENIVAFDRPYHEVPNRQALYQNVEGTVLGLPNTNFSTNSFLLDISRYDVAKENVSLFRYPDLFLVESVTKIRKATGQSAPIGSVKVEGNQVYFGGNCLLDALVFQEQGTCDIPRAVAEIKTMGITSVILYKNYVTDFFFNCDQKCDFYEDTEAILSANSDTFVPIYEDGEGVVYTIR